MRLINNYDETTKEFTLQTEAEPNQLEAGQYLLPAQAVYDDEFPLNVLGENEVNVWNGAGWTTTPDFRESVYYYIETGETVVFELGDSPDVTMSLIFPPTIQAQIDEKLRVSEIRQAGIAIIAVEFPALNNIDEIKFQAEFFKSIDVAARNPTPAFQMVIDVYTVAVDAIAAGTPSADVAWP